MGLFATRKSRIVPFVCAAALVLAEGCAPPGENRKPPSSAFTFQSGGLDITVEAVGEDVYRIRAQSATASAQSLSQGPVQCSAGPLSVLRHDPAVGHLLLTVKNPQETRICWQGALRTIEGYGRMKVRGIEIAWDAIPDEFLCGLGERFDALNQYGKHVDMWIKDEPGQGGSREHSYYVTPVLYSSRGYALFAADNPEGDFDLNSESAGRHVYRRGGGSLVLYLAADRTLAGLIRKRSSIQGPRRGIPDWAWGPWISRNSFENQSEAEEAIWGMAKRGIPVAAIVQEAWKGTSESGEFNMFSRERWPDLDRYFALCRAQNIRTILWQVPILHPSSPEYREAETRGFLVKRPDGTPSLRQGWMAGFAHIDFTKPEATAFWQNLMRPLIRSGVSGFKADDGEDIRPDDLFADGRHGWQVHNEYSTLYNRALTQLLEQEGADGMLWARSGSLGNESCPGLWAGDQYATWEQLRSLLPAGLSASVSGMPFWGHDIGGYMGQPTPELYIRWAQFGAFSPSMQYHGVRRREPWEFGEQAERAYRKLAHLRMNLRPTLIALGKEAVANGLPIMRPMLLEFPGDRRFDPDDSQYMLGPDLLVAPVIEEGASGRSIRFPAGRWQHLLDRTAYAGPSETFVEIGLESAPVFVREGATLRVELDEGAPLGHWRPGAPTRSIAFPSSP